MDINLRDTAQVLIDMEEYRLEDFSSGVPIGWTNAVMETLEATKAFETLLKKEVIKELKRTYNDRNRPPRVG